MLAPEVWNFGPPSVAIQVEKGSLRNAKECVDFSISNHSFNHSITTIFPTDTKIPASLTNGPGKESDFYRISDLPVFELISPDFLSNFVKLGKITMLSVGTQIDCDTCVSLTPTGILVLSLEKVAYERLGLEGKPSFFCRIKPPSRYIVKIDLTDSSFKPKKKNYERVLKCLMQNLKLKMDFVVLWDSPDTSICSSSVAAYFDSIGYRVQTGKRAISTRKMMEVQVPNLLIESETEESMEWIGAVAIGADMENWFESSTELILDQDVTNLPIQVCQWTGLHSSQQIASYFEEIRMYLKEQPDIPWICIHVQGFEDSAVHWKLIENTFIQSAENSYTIIVDSRENFLLYKTFGANRKLKTRSK